MSKYHILFLLVLLPGCKGCGGSQPSPAPPENCIKVQAACVGLDADVARIYIPALFDAYYRTASDCMVQRFGPQYKADPGPVVRVVTFRPMGWSGWTSWVDGQITIQATEHHLMMHEAVHYLLWREGLSNDDNTNHRPMEIFNSCGATNDGTAF